MTNFKMTVRAGCAVSARSPLPPKALAHWLSGVGGGGGGRESAFGQECKHPTPLLASEIKQTFVSTKLDSLLASEL